MKEIFKKAKKTISLLLAAGMAAGLIGCGKGSGETDKVGLEADTVRTGQENASASAQGKTQTGQEIAGNYYAGEYETLLETATIDKPAVSDTAVYYARWYPSGSKVFKYDMETEQTTEILLGLGEEESIIGLCVNEEGNLVAVKAYFEDSGNGKPYYWILVFSEDGTVLLEKDITDIVAEEAEITSYQYAYAYVDGLAVGKEGRICFCAMYTVWVLDKEGNLEFSIRPDEYIYNMGTLPDGNIAVSEYVYKGSKVSVLDLEKQEWEGKYASSHFDESLSFAESGDGGIYFYTTKELFSFDLESQEATIAADWIENDIIGDDVCYVSVLPDGNLRVVASDSTRSGGGTEMAFLKQTDVKERAQKEIVTLGTIELTGGMRSAVTTFNRRNDRYRVEVIEYAQGTTYNEGVKLFNSEVVAGNMPDVMNITDGTEEFYAAKGVFEDLKPYLDGENGIDRSEYFDNILTAMETNGKLYALSPDFMIKSLVGRKSVVGDGYGWTLEDIAALEESRGENVELMDHEYSRDVLRQFLYYNMAQFFDLDAGVCDFDNEDFKKILEFAGRFPISNPYHDEDPNPLLLANEGELLLLPLELDSIAIYQAYCQIFNADISCVGYPGNYACGSVAKGGDMTIVMSEKSQNKEGAWEFIRSFLEKEYQHRYTTCFPVLRSAYDRRAAEAMWVDYETGEKQASGNSYGFGGPEFIVLVEDVAAKVPEEVKKLIEKIERMERIDIQILNIVFEEADAYFAGQKTADEVVSIIQSRANIYMNENK